jgi:uncharacterized protein YybS (DUF2232 family)
MAFLDQDASPSEEENWLDGGETPQDAPPAPEQNSVPRPATLALVETAFLASTASLIWLINYYFPLGPLLRIFFPLPLALVYLRWGAKTAGKGAIAAGLLLSVLMGPTRSVVFLIPYGLMSLQLGFCWSRRAPWWFSIVTGALIGTFGFFFRFWLFSILLGENLWQYVIAQATGLIDWLLLQLNILAQPDIFVVQSLAISLILVNSLVYLVVAHLVALIVFDRLGNPIPRPPQWLQVILDYE